VGNKTRGISLNGSSLGSIRKVYVQNRIQPRCRCVDRLVPSSVSSENSKAYDGDFDRTCLLLRQGSNPLVDFKGF
jgi:hypothetical protein